MVKNSYSTKDDATYLQILSLLACISAGVVGLLHYAVEAEDANSRDYSRISAHLMAIEKTFSDIGNGRSDTNKALWQEAKWSLITCGHMPITYREPGKPVRFTETYKNEVNVKVMNDNVRKHRNT